MFVMNLIARIKAYLRYRRNVEALSRLSDRELADIGLSRWTIDDVARNASRA
jgi:uncharacterized protein YjiS (DUF1127 family)